MKAMKIGYARVSTDGQDTAAQVAALEAAGCEVIYKEKASGGTWKRPELYQALERIGPDDVLIVWKLDRLSRSVGDLILLIERLNKAGARFRSLTEEIDTTSAAGKLMMHILSSFAQFEREMLRERTLAGLKYAREQGRVGGPKFKLLSDQKDAVIRMVTKEDRSLAYCARIFKVHPSTISRLIERTQAAGMKETA